MLMSQTQKRLSDSTETDSDSETEMTVIRPKLNRKMRLGSNQSYGSYGKKPRISYIISGHCSTAMHMKDCLRLKRLMTRMHSSRMRTGRLLTVFRGLLFPGECTCQRGDVYLPEGGCTCRGVYLPGGCTCQGGVPARGVYLPGGVPGGGTCQGGCTCPRGCTCQRGVPARGVYLPGGYLPGLGGVPTWSGGCLVRYSPPC